MNAELTLLHAPWVAPMDGPCIRDGAVVFANSRIVAVGDSRSLRHDYREARIVELNDSIILPGLVNAHTHLELSDCQCGLAKPKSFADWLAGMLARTRIDAAEMLAKVTAAIELGVSQCVRFGVTSVGDISRQCRITRSLLRDAPLRVISYGEIQAMGQRRVLLEERLETALDAQDATDRLRIGLSPHAPYSVEVPVYQRCLSMARNRGLPLATHLAETADERPFLMQHAGPLRELWNAWLTWDDDVPTYSGGPIEMARDVGLLDYPTLLAHVNFCNDDELAMLAAGQPSVVYCPRTHAYFGHPPHRWRDMLAAGINVAVGTDSCASSPDLNLVDDLRLLRRIAPEVPAQTLWEMATTRAALAIGTAGDVGRLTPGTFADFVVFPAEGDDPLAEILENHRLPTDVWINGEQLRST